MIDLHCHSSASDGSYSPKELINMAEKLNITHLALTDHDTTAGISEFMAQKSIVNRIPGIEISVEVEKGELHIVGLFIDINNKTLQEMEEEVQYYRRKRNEKMIAALSKLVKKNVKIGDLIDNPDSQLGRPHVAKYLLRNNIVTSIQEAFDLYLKDNSSLAFKKQQVSVDRALNVIKNESGYQDIFIPAMCQLSNSYREYYEALQKANEVFLRRYPDGQNRLLNDKKDK